MSKKAKNANAALSALEELEAVLDAGPSPDFRADFCEAVSNCFAAAKPAKGKAKGAKAAEAPAECDPEVATALDRIQAKCTAASATASAAPSADPADTPPPVVGAIDWSSFFQKAVTVFGPALVAFLRDLFSGV